MLEHTAFLPAVAYVRAALKAKLLGATERRRATREKLDRAAIVNHGWDYMQIQYAFQGEDEVEMVCEESNNWKGNGSAGQE